MSLLLQADARALPLPDQYVQTCITSPPYWGLRDYATAGQIGRSDTPDGYVADCVAAFREVWRVLRDDGTLWLNLGDSFATSPGKTGSRQGTTGQRASRTYTADVAAAKRVPPGMKEKDLVGIPWMVAFALRADGWYLRSDIIWAKPNPMPESVTDRPTRSHEYLFLLTKSKKYYYDQAAIAEPAVAADRRRADRMGGNKYVGKNEESGERRKVGFNERWATKHSDGSVFTGSATRNKRSVWTVTPEPYKGAHFATFPQALVEPCLLAGSADWQVDHPRSVVLDPFCGSGTVGLVARKHGRFFIGCDLSLPYLKLAQDRLCG